MASSNLIARFESKLDAMRSELGSMRSELNIQRWLMGLGFAALVADAIAQLFHSAGSLGRHRRTKGGRVARERAPGQPGGKMRRRHGAALGPISGPYSVQYGESAWSAGLPVPLRRSASSEAA